MKQAKFVQICFVPSDLPVSTFRGAFVLALDEEGSLWGHHGTSWEKLPTKWNKTATPPSDEAITACPYCEEEIEADSAHMLGHDGQFAWSITSHYLMEHGEPAGCGTESICDTLEEALDEASRNQRLQGMEYDGRGPKRVTVKQVGTARPEFEFEWKGRWDNAAKTALKTEAARWETAVGLG